MQHPWTIEINGSYHQQQLLTEAANERLASQATRGTRAQTNGRRIVRTLVAPMLVALGVVTG